MPINARLAAAGVALKAGNAKISSLPPTMFALFILRITSAAVATPDHQPTILQRQDEKYARRLHRPRTHMLNQPEASARFVGESYGFLLGSQQFSIVSIFA
jgi:hypothetical protein